MDRWLAAPGPLAGGPPPGVAAVWRLRFDEAPQDAAPLLSPDERARAERFLRAEPRREFVVTRMALRRLAGAYLGRDPAALAFAAGPGGKPELIAGAGLRFNVAHTRGVALLAFARNLEVGVDAEAHGPERDLAGLARRYFAADEVAELEALPAEMRTAAFFRGWARKEAFVKAVGAGVAFGLDRFSVSLAPGAPAMLLRVAGDPAAAARWRIHHLDAGPAVAAALAADASATTIECFEAARGGAWLFDAIARAAGP